MAGDSATNLEYLGPAPSAEAALATLGSEVAGWFRQRFGEPTPAQRLAWPTLAAGKSALLCAPTGSGKTLAALLPVLNQLLHGPPSRGIRCLGVAPLKALCNDAARNLRDHVTDLRSCMPECPVELRVGVRTGDSSAAERRELRQQPPDVLLTTPESLAVLLSQPQSLEIFAELQWVVVDELHALAAGKRGADLALSLERLEVLTSDRLLRIGLSATSTPLSEMARFLAGTTRPVAIAHVADSAPLELTVEPLEDRSSFVAQLLDRLLPELAVHRTVLVFTNVRSLSERLAWALRRRFPDRADQVGVHHSALAAARRRGVESRLKDGQLRIVFSSTSLELGVDIGSVDLVVLVHPPGDVIRFLQRVGRSGHGPGRPRRGLVLTAGPSELLEAAVTAASSRSSQIEPLRVLAHPLDVLCQQLLGMAAQQPWTPGEAFELVRRAYPYHDLSRGDFDVCLDYLSGCGRDGQPWLPARLGWAGEEFHIRDESTARLLRRNLGTILTEEPRQVQLVNPRQDGGAGGDSASEFPAPGLEVGQLDEAFADRLQPGDRFLLDGRCLEYCQADGSGLLVQEVHGRPVVPVWGGEGWPLSTELARRLYLLRVQAAEALREGPHALLELLQRDYALDDQAAAVLAAYFQRQECVSEIPDPATLLIEIVGGETGATCYVHTPLNRPGNDALARAAVHRLVHGHGRSVTSVVADLGLAFIFRGTAEPTPDLWRELLSANRFEEDLDAALADSVALRERFRRVACTGLMLLRNPIGRRRRVGGRDWAERRLFDQVRVQEPDFVLLRQAAREVRHECCDGAAARDFLEELPARTVRVRRLAQVSPFAGSWTQLAAGPAEAVQTPAEVLRRLHATLTQSAPPHAGSYRLAANP